MSLFSHPDEKRLEGIYLELERVGLRLTSHYSLEELVSTLKREGLHTPLQVLEGMGGPFGKMPYFHFSDDVWSVELSDVEDPQAYSDFAIRLGRLVRETVTLSNIFSDLSEEGHQAVLEFEADGKPYRWEFECRDQSIDPKFFGRFVGLLESYPSQRSLAFRTDGSSMTVVYVTPENLAQLRLITGADWDVLALHH